MNPLKCPDCSDFRALIIKFVRFEKNNRGVDYNVPFFECPNCGNSEPIDTLQKWQIMAEKDRQNLQSGEYVSIVFDYENKKFERYDHLELKYDSIDYYLIPGLENPWDDGYLTPVFFDKDLLLYYNNHNEYSVRLSSFSSGNIYFRNEPLFNWGFGINRSGKIFKWLGDLDADFSHENMKLHLKRFQASNIESDHDVYSKFYLSQIPYSVEDAFQGSDNEYQIFKLKNAFDKVFKDEFSLEFSKLDIGSLSEYYKQPMIEERHQIFNAYGNLDKYLVENIRKNELKQVILRSGVSENELKDLGSLKLFEKFMEHVLKIQNFKIVISPLYVLNDLRQLQSHLAIDSFDKKYNSCKERLKLDSSASDFAVYYELNKKIIEMFETLNGKLNGI